MPSALSWAGALLLAGVLAQTEVACAGAEPTQTPTAVLTVAPDGSADHTSIQAAIDAAPVGALVRVAPGTYEEHLVVDKALTLEGENWSSTRITFRLTSVLETEPELALSMTNEMDAAQSDLERARIRERYFLEQGPWPVLRVEGAGPVEVSGLQFELTGEIYADRTAQMAAVWIDHSQVVLRDCAVTGSPGSGIGILMDSDVQVLSTFVGGIGGSGIAIVGDRFGTPPRVLVADCELRGFGQQAIAIESGNTSTRIEHCRISGSWTYGIHYQDASPVIEGNEIFDNEVAGVHSTGSTSAVVRENLIRSNRRTGMSCVFENGDTIERNTFTGNYESGLEILGAARPAVHRNVFHDSPSGVFVDQVSEGKEARQRRPDSIDVRSNIFASVRQWIRLESLKPAHSEHQRVIALASKGDNRFVDPGFVDPAAGDFRLRHDSEARALGIGAGTGAQPDAESTGLEPDGSTARATEGEARLTAKFLEREATNQRSKEEYERHKAASSVAEPWIEGLMRIWNDEARAQAFAQMCEALESDDPLQRHAGLIALAASSDVNLDRERLVPRLIELARIETGQAQVKALYGLETAGHRPDCELVRSLLRDDPSPALRASGVQLLSWACAKDFTGETGPLVLSLLESAGPFERRQHLSFLRGVTVSKEIETWILGIASTATDPEAHFAALGFGLSGIQNKSSEVVDRLIEALSSQRTSEGKWALWGLGFGVVPEAQERVADAALTLFEVRSGMDWREGALDVLESYGSAKHLVSVRALAADEALVPPLRLKAERAATAIEARAGG
ncbi:MAG TPA: right-handed parallel beta-helix repeat-containing protein [Planctomycetota bacterium]|nr:right-handed parallel beta-helix repeat-containing protein [Planctomycetota bacterium]